MFPGLVLRCGAIIHAEKRGLLVNTVWKVPYADTFYHLDNCRSCGSLEKYR